MESSNPYSSLSTCQSYIDYRTLHHLPRCVPDWVQKTVHDGVWDKEMQLFVESEGSGVAAQVVQGFDPPYAECWCRVNNCGHFISGRSGLPKHVRKAHAPLIIGNRAEGRKKAAELQIVKDTYKAIMETIRQAAENGDKDARLALRWDPPPKTQKEIHADARAEKKRVAAEKKAVKAAGGGTTKHRRKVNLEDDDYDPDEDMEVKDSKAFDHKAGRVIRHDNPKSPNDLFTIHVAKGVEMPMIPGKTFKSPNISALLRIISVYDDGYKSLCANCGKVTNTRRAYKQCTFDGACAGRDYFPEWDVPANWYTGPTHKGILRRHIQADEE
ncbi:uncharacterized protein BDR25DRAFT_347674 [Lindgomyces ingoldianus]|uniref:Uncharacterized protein n=1 Tax=Lindgomyces ingoldianus TaxID=673940 RepID=A0ACB6Q723_9PLEO|nr:uncharacterized protein BDR25DRAFT_347674 [Lindgomyces ingoldianus]KAF2462615.1 hypothetical protein BDR25DRAFT_347674 [Lindgomyces ingoldianus]